MCETGYFVALVRWVLLGFVYWFLFIVVGSVFLGCVVFCFAVCFFGGCGFVLCGAFF